MTAPTRTTRFIIEVSVEGKVTDEAVAEAMFDFLVDTEDLPEIIFSVDNWEVIR